MRNRRQATLVTNSGFPYHATVRAVGLQRKGRSTVLVLGGYLLVVQFGDPSPPSAPATVPGLLGTSRHHRQSMAARQRGSLDPGHPAMARAHSALPANGPLMARKINKRSFGSGVITPGQAPDLHAIATGSVRD
jgi:hypothetical protein